MTLINYQYNQLLIFLTKNLVIIDKPPKISQPLYVFTCAIGNNIGGLIVHVRMHAKLGQDICVFVNFGLISFARSVSICVARQTKKN
jgi:hypothetical protein